MFARPPRSTLISVLKELYANARKLRDFKVFVSCKWIPFNRTSINMFYNLLDIDDDQYSRLHEKGVDPNEIIRILDKLDTTWKRSEIDVINFSSSGMTMRCKARCHFIPSKLISSNNKGRVQVVWEPLADL